MDVVFLGTNDAGYEIYEWLCDRESVAVRALLTEPDQLSLVEALEPDVVVACGFAHVVPPAVLGVPDEGCVNVHPGLLPETRGYNPNVWSIVEDLPAGATVHYMDEGIDTGDVIARREVEQQFDDTGRDLYRRIERACVDLFAETWPAIERGDVDATPQAELGPGEPDDAGASGRAGDASGSDSDGASDDSARASDDADGASDDGGTYHVQADFEELCALDPDAEYTVRELLDRLRALTFPPFDNAHVEVDGERYYVDVSIRHEDAGAERTDDRPSDGGEPNDGGKPNDSDERGDDRSSDGAESSDGAGGEGPGFLDEY